MKIFIKNIEQLNDFSNCVNSYFEKTYLRSNINVIKESIAKYFNFESYKALENKKVPFEIETETFFFKFVEFYYTEISAENDGKQRFFASMIHSSFVKKHITDDLETVIEIAMRLKDPEIFYDRGWGDSGQKAAISIINDGDGQFPYIFMSKKVYESLKERKLIGENILQTFKARKIHKFDKTKIKLIATAV